MNFDKQSPDFLKFSETLKQGIWFLGVACWLFGMIDRSIASLNDGYLSGIDIIQLLTAAFFFVSWLFLKPYPSIKGGVSND